MAHDVIPTSTGDTLPPFDPATFWTRFRHGTASVAGVRLHFVEGGDGAPILLLPAPELVCLALRHASACLRGATRRRS